MPLSYDCEINHGPYIEGTSKIVQTESPNLDDAFPLSLADVSNLTGLSIVTLTQLFGNVMEIDDRQLVQLHLDPNNKVPSGLLTRSDNNRKHGRYVIERRDPENGTLIANAELNQYNLDFLYAEALSEDLRRQAKNAANKS